MSITRFFYDTCTPINAVNSVYFQRMADAIAAIGPGYKAPKYNQLQTNLLGNMKKEVQLVVSSYRSVWEERGCTIMADGLQDRSNRQLIWSPCAAHCLNLILGDIGKMDLVCNLAKRATSITKFVYKHAFLLAWLRLIEGWTEIVRPVPTRFATTFIALKSILEHQHDFQACFNSKTSKNSRYSKEKKASGVVAVAFYSRFWSDCKVVVGVCASLIRMKRITDIDRRPSIGYVYDGTHKARRAIKNILKNKKKLYKPFTSIIKDRWDKQLRRDIQVFNILYFLDEWWRVFGCSAPNIQSLAIKILSQTSSSWGCERNWSVFERIHIKKRNRLEH
ncbi:hypothetical protein F511_36795 [Dorcoceras hygrometricum]|uniref:HAT C-terminal dimerisation domain-containing protein n=1 Tax=Dorcoceras hygrometricum TaxID=472368 RepID=A0A2Z7DD67_9LAMI|nr:hypothetical protein F511_36795 [Dorcoceras hygrometricum]